MSWTEERITKFKKLYADNLSYAAIAQEIGGLEHCRDGGRNACIGMAGRLGLPKREKTTDIHGTQHMAHGTKPAKPKTKRRAYIAPWSPPTTVTPEPPPPKPSLDHCCRFADLANNSCRFPLWGEQAPADEQFFCGVPTADVDAHRPYCAYHQNLCWTPAPARKPRPYHYGVAAE